MNNFSSDQKPCQEAARLQHTGLSLQKGEEIAKTNLKISWTGLWSFWKSQLSALFLAAEAEAGGLLSKPVEEGAEWKQIWEKRPRPLKPDPWCGKGEYSQCEENVTLQKPGPYCEEECTDGWGGDTSTAGKDGKVSSLVGGTTKPHSLRSQRDCQIITELPNLSWTGLPNDIVTNWQ